MNANIILSVAIGISATLCIDAWNMLLKRAFGIPSLNYCFLGRWVAHLSRGVVRHAGIVRTPVRRFECGLGWLAHYGIGVGLAALFVLMRGDRWLAAPTLLPALVYGIVTVVFPFFVLQPALGLGIASSATPHPWRARAKSLATHAAYGLGLYLAACVAQLIAAR